MRDPVGHSPPRASSSNLSRRHFVATSSAVLAAGLVMPVWASSRLVAEAAGSTTVTAALPHDALASLGREHFLPLVGQRFRFAGDGSRAVTAVLTDVRQQPQTSRSAALRSQPRLDHFTLIFRSDARPLASATYQIEHAGLGRFPLFLVSRPTLHRGTEYVAVFNRLLS